jgi:hypothetical protein
VIKSSIDNKLGGGSRTRKRIKIKKTATRKRIRIIKIKTNKIKTKRINKRKSRKTT